jgi:glycogen(starch) synthase
MKLLIIHPDNPANEMTWSRTPFFLTNALRSKGANVIHFKTGPDNKILIFLLKLIQFYTRLDYHYSYLFRKIASRRLIRAIHKYKPDSVLHLGPSSAITFLNTNVPNYLYCDNTWNILNTLGREFLNPIPNESLYNRINGYSKIDYNKFNAIFTQTTLVKNNLIDYYKINGNKIHVIGVGMGNIKPLYESKDYNKKQILFIARNSFKRKGGDLLLEAFKIVKKQVPDATLIFEGGSAPSNIKLDGVEVKGLSNQIELQRLYKDSYVLAMPSLSEPFGLVYLEALASNTAILGLNRGALPDITQNGKYGFLVDKPNVADVAEKLIYMLNNKDIVMQKTKEAQKFVLNEFNWDTVGSKILDELMKNEHS